MEGKFRDPSSITTIVPRRTGSVDNDCWLDHGSMKAYRALSSRHQHTIVAKRKTLWVGPGSRVGASHPRQHGARPTRGLFGDHPCVCRELSPIRTAARCVTLTTLDRLPALAHSITQSALPLPLDPPTCRFRLTASLGAPLSRSH